MGALVQAAKDEDMELEMDMELSGGSGSGRLDGLLSFADDDRPELKPSGLELQTVDAAGNQQLATNTGKKKRYHRHTAHQIQQMEA